MPTPLKEKLNPHAIQTIASVLKKCDNTLDTDKFVKECLVDLENYELKDRVGHIIKCLHKIFPHAMSDVKKILVQVPRHMPREDCRAGWFDFSAWPLIDYLGVYGVDEQDISLELLKELTHLFSAEFAIRPFLQKHFELTVKHLGMWVLDEDEHVRRLVSEGTRLRLPWAKNIDILFDNIDITLPLILKLVDDESMYVRKSVANHLNDISKYHPNLVISTCQDILKNPTKNREWLVKHATRTLRKKGIIS